MFPHTKPPAGTQINPLHPLSRGLVGCWLFNEGAGSLANDLSGNKNHGRLTNMAPNVQGSGWGNGGLDFDGDNDYVNCGNDNSLNITDAITISMQIQPNFSETALEHYILVDKVIAASGALDAYRLMYNTAENDFRFRITASAPVNCDTNGLTWAAGTRHHIVGTYDGAHMRIFWDGIENNSEIQTGCMTTTDLDLRIGVIAGEDDVYHFDGGINSVHIYNRALSAEEVAWSYREPYTMFEPSFNPALLYSAAPPVGAIMNQFQRANIGADLYNGVFA